MSDHTPTLLTPILVDIESPEFLAISGWPFADPFVGRLLREAIPRRVLFGEGRFWVYRDPEGRLAGFGTLDVCEDYRAYTAGRPHPCIPLPAVNPTIPSLGYGTSIVRHLIGEAALRAFRGGYHDVRFLDVYAESTNAISLYHKCGSFNLFDAPLPDPADGGKDDFVMARSVAIATT